MRQTFHGVDTPNRWEIARPGICSFGGGGSQTSTSTQTVDPRIWDYVSRNANRSESIANQPFQAYTAEQTAPLSGNQNLAIGAAKGLNQAGAPALDYAMQGAQGMVGYNPQQVSAGRAVSQGDLSGLIPKYFNPYENQVVANTLSDINRQRDLALGQNQDRAIAARAFGNSRHGVADSLTQDAYGRTSADAAGNLRMAGFNTAAGLAGQEAGMNQQTELFNVGAGNAANMANQSADLQGAGVRNSAGALLANVGNSQQNNAQTYLSSLIGTGALEQQNRQQYNDAQYQEFMRRIGYPAQGQGLINQSLGLLPSSGTTTATAPRPDQTANYLAAGGSLLGGAGMLFGGSGSDSTGGWF